MKDSPSVKSPVSGTSLPLLIGADGEIYADYRVDLAQRLKENKRKSNRARKFKIFYGKRLLSSRPFQSHTP